MGWVGGEVGERLVTVTGMREVSNNWVGGNIGGGGGGDGDGR